MEHSKYIFMGDQSFSLINLSSIDFINHNFFLLTQNIFHVIGFCPWVDYIIVNPLSLLITFENLVCHGSFQTFSVFSINKIGFFDLIWVDWGLEGTLKENYAILGANLCEKF